MVQPLCEALLERAPATRFHAVLLEYEHQLPKGKGCYLGLWEHQRGLILSVMS